MRLKVVGFVPILSGLPGKSLPAPLSCHRCGDLISHVEGPRYGALCLDCTGTVLLKAAEDDCPDTVESSGPGA